MANPFAFVKKKFNESAEFLAPGYRVAKDGVLFAQDCDAFKGTGKLFALELCESIARNMMLKFLTQAVYRALVASISSDMITPTEAITGPLLKGRTLLYAGLFGAAYLVAHCVLRKVRHEVESDVKEKTHEKVMELYRHNLPKIALHANTVNILQDGDGITNAINNYTDSKFSGTQHRVIKSASYTLSAFLAPWNNIAKKKLELDKLQEQTTELVINVPKLLRAIVVDLSTIYIIWSLSRMLPSGPSFILDPKKQLMLSATKYFAKTVSWAIGFQLANMLSSQTIKVEEAKRKVEELHKIAGLDAKATYLSGTINIVSQQAKELEMALKEQESKTRTARILVSLKEVADVYLNTALGIGLLMVQAYNFGVHAIMSNWLEEQIEYMIPTDSYSAECRDKLDRWKKEHIVETSVYKNLEHVGAFAYISKVWSGLDGMEGQTRNSEDLGESALRIRNFETLSDKVNPNDGSLNVILQRSQSSAANVLESFNVLAKSAKQSENTQIDIEYGEITAIYGASGLGKSTLLEALMGITLRYQGEVTIDEKITQQDINFIQSNGIYLPVAKVSDIVTASSEKRPSDEQISNVLRCFFTGAEVSSYMQGEALLSTSDGQRVRLKLAQAILQGAKIIFADESFGKIASGEKETNLVGGVAHTMMVLKHYCKHGSEHLMNAGPEALSPQYANVVEQENHAAMVFVTLQEDILQSVDKTIVLKPSEQVGFQAAVGNIGLLNKAQTLEFGASLVRSQSTSRQNQ